MRAQVFDTCLCRFRLLLSVDERDQRDMYLRRAAINTGLVGILWLKGLPSLLFCSNTKLELSQCLYERH